MLQQVTDALMWAKEYQEWGWNATSLSALVILVMTIPEVFGLVQQGRHIWREKSGESVSNTMFLFSISFFLVCAIFGWEQHSIAMIGNAALTGLVQLYALVGLYKYKGFSRQEKISGAAFTLMVVWELFTPYKGESYLIFSFGLWYAFGRQAWELWESGTTGVLDKWLVGSYAIATTAWTVFAFAGDSLWFKLSQVGVFSTIMSVAIIWCWYRWKETHPKEDVPNIPLGKWLDILLQRD